MSKGIFFSPCSNIHLWVLNACHRSNLTLSFLSDTPKTLQSYAKQHFMKNLFCKKHKNNFKGRLVFSQYVTHNTFLSNMA
jgi:hypothetical protein